MKIDGTYLINAPRATVWPMMIDPAVLQRCVPGCESLEANPDGSYKMTLKAGVGSIKGTFDGTIRLSDLQEPAHYQMNVEGKGKVGFVKGAGVLDFVEEGETTVIHYTGDVSVGGTIASVGQRMVQSSAKLMANQFFKAVAAEAEPAKADPSGLVKKALGWFSGKDEKTEVESEPNGQA
jgi:hypothetical protein